MIHLNLPPSTRIRAVSSVFSHWCERKLSHEGPTVPPTSTSRLHKSEFYRFFTSFHAKTRSGRDTGPEGCSAHPQSPSLAHAQQRRPPGHFCSHFGLFCPFFFLLLACADRACWDGAAPGLKSPLQGFQRLDERPSGSSRSQHRWLGIL